VEAEIMKRKGLVYKKLLTILLIFSLVGNLVIPLIPTAHAQKLVSSINLAISGEIVEHAFGDTSYDAKFYKKMELQVTASFSDGTSSNFTKDASFTSTDDQIVVTSDGQATGTGNTEGFIIVTYQNKQAAIEVNSNWDYVSTSYALNLLNETTYGDLLVSEVVFKDSNFENAIRGQLNKPVGTITKDDMSLLTSLDVGYRNIQHLNGLEFAVNLESLYMEGNQISDLTPVSKLTKLKSLWLGKNNITDLTSLGSLSNLTELYAEENQITSLVGLEKLTNLTILDLHQNQIGSIKAIRGLAHLTTLNLNKNQINTITTLSNLASLNSLQLSQNKITELDVLVLLSQLEWVDVLKNPLNDKSPNVIRQLETRGVSVDFAVYDSTLIEFADPNLEKALSEYLKIRTPLKKGDLQQIQSLDLSNQGITNLKGLEYASDLQYLNLSTNFITNMDMLLNLGQINWVDISRNPLASSSLEAIQVLELNGVYISYDLDYDPSPVEFADPNLENAIMVAKDLTKPVTKGDLSKLDYLFLINENISSLKGLEHATNLIGLSIWSNNLTSINELQYLDQLTYVDITRNPLNTSEGSESSTIIKELAAKGVEVHYDVNFDSSIISITDPNLEYILGDLVGIPTMHLSKGDFSQMESLDLNSRNIIHLDGIEHAQILKTLYLDNNKISNLAPLASMIQLNELHLRNNQIKDLTPLLGLTNLRYLDVRNNLFQATPGSSARDIISKLQQRGVVVNFNESSDTFITGIVVDENGPLTKYSYISVNGNGNNYQTSWDSRGEFSLKLGDGFYSVTGITVHTINRETFPGGQSFEVRNGNLYVNGEQKETLEVQLSPITLKGKVVDEFGVPVGNAFLQLEGNNQSNGIQVDGEGNFFSRLVDGVYNVFSVRIGNEDISVAIPFELREGKQYVNGLLTETLEVKLPPATLKGSVLDENGLPVVNTYVQVNGLNRSYGSQTDSQGNFSFRLVDGAYTIAHVSYGIKGVSPNISFEIIDGKIYVNGELKERVLVSILPVTFKGIVVDENGFPVTNAYVSVNGNNKWYGTETDSQGNFSFRLEDGSYRLNYIDIGNESAPQNLEFTIQDGKFFVNGMHKDRLEIKLAPFSLKGTLYDENGQLLPNTYMQVEKNYQGVGTNTDVEGKFRLRLADGIYKVTYVYTANKWVELNVPFEIKGGKLFVNGELKEALEVKLPAQSLKAAVVDENGLRVSNTYIEIDGNNRKLGMHSDSQGIFSYSLEDGTYKITYASIENNAISLNISFEIKEGKLYVNGELKDQLEVRLPPVTLKGILKDVSGLTIANARVSVNGNGRTYTVSTDSQGFYKFRLIDGNYKITYASDTNGEFSLNIPFDIVERNLLVNGNPEDQITINLLPLTFKGSLKNSNDTPVTTGNIYLLDYKNGRWYNAKMKSDGTVSGRFADGDYVIYKVNDILLNKKFSIINGKMMENNQSIDQMNIKLTQIKTFNAILTENAQAVPNSSISVGYLNGMVTVGFGTNSTGVASLSLQDGLYIITSVWKNEVRISLSKPIILEIIDGKLLVNGLEQQTLQVEINQQQFSFNGNLKNWDGSVLKNSVLSLYSNGRVQYINTDENGLFNLQLSNGNYHIFEIGNSIIGKVITNETFSIENGNLVQNGLIKEGLTISLPKTAIIKGMLKENHQVAKNRNISMGMIGAPVSSTISTNEFGAFQSRLVDGDYFVKVFDLNNDNVLIYKEFKVREGKLLINDVPKESLELSIIPTPSAPLVDEVNDLSLQVTGFAEVGSTITVKNGETVLGTGLTKEDGIFIVTIDLQQSGTILTVIATNTNGDASEATRITVVDKTAPMVPFVYEVDDQSVEVKGTAEVGSTVTVENSGVFLGSAKTREDGTFIVLVIPQQAGTTLTVTATDTNGNTSEATVVTVVDKTAPLVPVVHQIHDQSVVITGTAEVGSTVTVKNGVTIQGSAITLEDGTFTVTIVPQLAGATLTVTATDSAGNVSESVDVTVISSETVQSISFGNDFYKVGTNGKVKFSVSATLLNGEKIDITDKINLSISDPEIVALTKDGFLKGLKEGYAVISAEYEGLVVMAKVQVFKGDISIPRR
jgi:Leucine-rich repeat (LRR) protein/protocatechuate 3,4-dioxygenase beta subunit/major membrane immunogen (membrane-anchored lipoprotein)